MSTKRKGPSPIGSGVFALAVGVGFFCLIDRKIDPALVFKAWIIFAAVLLTVWGGRRIFKCLSTTSNWKDLRWEVGQPTLNFVVGVIAATAALFALMGGKT